MLGLNQSSGCLTILSLPRERCKNLQDDLIASYLTLNVALKKTQLSSTQVTGLCSAWASVLRQKKLWSLARVQLTTGDFRKHSGEFYQELSLLLITVNLTLQDFETWRVDRTYGLIRCSPPTVLTSVLDALGSNNYLSKK